MSERKTDVLGTLLSMRDTANQRAMMTCLLDYLAHSKFFLDILAGIWGRIPCMMLFKRISFAHSNGETMFEKYGLWICPCKNPAFCHVFALQ